MEHGLGRTRPNINVSHPELSCNSIPKPSATLARAQAQGQARPSGSNAWRTWVTSVYHLSSRTGALPACLFLYHITKYYFTQAYAMGSRPLADLPCLLFLLLLLRTFSHPTDDCPRECGGIDIPFPFGTGPNCSLPGFRVSCIHHPHPPLPYLTDTQLRILSIHNGELRVDSAPFIATDCNDGRRALATISLPFDGPFTISGASNRFVAIGCDTVAVVADGGTFTSGCVSLCSTRESVLSPGGACSGVGCCEAAVPSGRRYLSMGAGNMFGYVNVSAFDNCSYSFVVERGAYEFREKDLREFPGGASIAMRLEWAVGDEGGGGCGENAYRLTAVRGSGFLCNCTEGYAGNPYLNGSGGCQGTRLSEFIN